MKILHVAPSLSLETGGPARAVLGFSGALARRAEKVSVFSTDDGFETGTRTPRAEPGVNVETFRRLWPRRYFYSPDLGRRLRAEVRNFDVVHVHGLWLYPTLAACEACRQRKVPYIVRPCGMLDRYSLSHHVLRKKLYGRLIERKNLDAAAAVHFTTLEEKSRSAAFGLKSPSVVIPLGLEVSDGAALPGGAFRSQFPEIGQRKIVLYLGRLSFKKGLDLLVEAFSELATEMPDVHWVIAGSDQENYGGKLRKWIRQKQIENRVTMIGFVEGAQKKALLRDSDVFCLPSHQENFGLAVAEAMAAGLPVVVSDQVNLHGEIHAAQAGLVTTCRAAEIRDALLRLLRDEDLRARMGENGKRLVREKFQWDRIAAELMAVYEGIAHRH